MHNVHTLAWYEVIKVKQTLISSAQLGLEYLPVGSSNNVNT